MNFFVLLNLSLYWVCISCQNNTYIYFEFDCIKINDFAKVCLSECDLIFNLCVQSQETKSEEGLKCEIFGSRYQVKFEKGMCKLGYHDSRGLLKKIERFSIKWEMFYVYVTTFMLQKSIKETQKIEVNKAHVYPNFITEKYSMEPFFSHSEQQIKIRFKINATCISNYYGEECKNYCVSTPYFNCNQNGSRKCLQNFTGEYCNIKDECSELANCTCTKESKCEHHLVPCSSPISKCDTKICNMDMISLNENCRGNNETYLQHYTKQITVTVSALGGIIVVLLVIIMLLGIYKGKRRVPADIQPYRHRRHIPLPNIRLTSVIDDYVPPDSEYADMCSQCFPQQNNNDSSGSFNTNISLPMRFPNSRFLQ